MCGILGIYSINNRNLEKKAHSTLELIKDRGPDSQKILFSGLNSDNSGYFGALGASRLAMVDPFGPDQPLQTWDKRYRIAFNGEIWNHRKLRKELESRGAIFSTLCDTEVVLYTVAEHGIKAPEHFKGQFAYIVEDTEKGIIYAGRDPHGICPLFYGKNREGEFIFGSTVKVLIANEVYREDIRILPQGYTLTYDIKLGNIKFNRYYDIMTNIKERASLPPVHHLRERLFKVIRQRIPQEVPYATIVGGIDSSLVTAACIESDKPPLCIISVTTTEDEDSTDVQNARLLSRELGIECRIGIVDEEYIRKNIERVINVLGSANYFEVVTGIVGLKAAEMVRESGAKALITGGGSDEIFGGYDFLWNMFDLGYIERNLLHVYMQSGIFECHREDSVTACVGIEARPAYYDRELAELLFSLPTNKKILGLGTGNITEKAILKQLAKGYIPDTIIETRKKPFYRSTSVIQLFEKVANKSISEHDAIEWKKGIIRQNPSWSCSMLMPGRGPVFIHKMFSHQFPGFEKLSIPQCPPDYNDPDSYGKFYGSFGSPILEGYKWFPKNLTN